MFEHVSVMTAKSMTLLSSIQACAYISRFVVATDGTKIDICPRATNPLLADCPAAGESYQMHYMFATNNKPEAWQASERVAPVRKSHAAPKRHKVIVVIMANMHCGHACRPAQRQRALHTILH